jgi:hypothetical protein
VDAFIAAGARFRIAAAADRKTPKPRRCRGAEAAKRQRPVIASIGINDATEPLTT